MRSHRERPASGVSFHVFAGPALFFFFFLRFSVDFSAVSLTKRKWLASLILALSSRSFYYSHRFFWCDILAFKPGQSGVNPPVPNQTDMEVYFGWQWGQFAVSFVVPVGVFSSRRSWKRILTCDCHMSVCISPPVHHRQFSEAVKGAGFGARRADCLATAAGRLMWNAARGSRWQLPQEVGRWGARALDDRELGGRGRDREEDAGNCKMAAGAKYSRSWGLLLSGCP